MNNCDTLTLEISVLSEKTYLNRPLMIQAVLHNSGLKPVMINDRMALGYENQISRELYFRIVRSENDQEADFPKADINRDLSKPKDYHFLPPGESRKAVFNLFEFYRLTKPGEYRVTLFYDPSEPYTEKPDSLPAGIVVSNTLKISVTSGE